MFDFIGDVLNSLVNVVVDAITQALGNFVGRICYRIVSVICKLLEIAYRFFAVFSGMDTVKYNNSKQYLINIFFGNDKINQVYWGMALIGFVIILAVTIVAIIKKTFDIENKEQRSLGSILLSAGKSGLVILLLSASMTAMLNLTNGLIKSVSYLFDNAGSLDVPISITFTDEQFATMARIYNTIGNYSLNDSYNNRYNLNSCYNELRGDLLLLEEDHVFDLTYDTTDGETWQSMLTKLYKAGDPSYEHSTETYDSTSNVLLEIMQLLKTDKTFYPVVYQKNTEYGVTGESVSIDRIIFLMGTLNAARNSRYNRDPQLTDGLRGAYYRGDRNIYSFSHVSDDFDTSITGISYLTIAISAWFTLKNLFICIFNCIGRIFNLLGLYIIAPPIAAVSPLDGGSMFKQWIQATVIQMFSIFGNIIPMRLVIMFVPIILDSNLIFFDGRDNTTLNIMAKVVMIVASMEASQRFSSVIVGILAGNAGGAAIKAGGMEDKAGAAFGAMSRIGGAAVGAAASGVAGGLGKVTGLSSVKRWAGAKIGGAASTASQYLDRGFGIIGAVNQYRKDAPVRQYQATKAKYDKEFAKHDHADQQTKMQEQLDKWKAEDALKAEGGDKNEAHGAAPENLKGSVEKGDSPQLSENLGSVRKSYDDVGGKSISQPQENLGSIGKSYDDIGGESVGHSQENLGSIGKSYDDVGGKSIGQPQENLGSIGKSYIDIGGEPMDAQQDILGTIAKKIDNVSGKTFNQQQDKSGSVGGHLSENLGSLGKKTGNDGQSTNHNGMKNESVNIRGSFSEKGNTSDKSAALLEKFTKNNFK